MPVRPKRKSILIVAATSRSLWEDPSTVYRALHLQSALRRMGVISRVVSLASFIQEEKDGTQENSFDAIIFHRPSYSEVLEEALERYSSRPLVADYDDYNFSLSIASELEKHSVWESQPQILWNSLVSNERAFVLFSKFSTSTRYLAKAVAEKSVGSTQHILPNHISPEFAEKARYVRASRKFSSDRIGYFGSHSHQPELDLIADEITDYLRRTGRIFIHSSQLNLDSRGMENQIFTFEPLSLDDAWRFYASVDVCIAPLISNRFNMAKSAVKLVEAQVHGVPLVSHSLQAIDSYRSAIQFPVTPQQGWGDALDLAFATNAEQRRSAASDLETSAGQEHFVDKFLRPFVEGIGL